MAGIFYPASAQQLRAQIRAFLSEAKKDADRLPAAKAVIAPHAGYEYSGPVAAHAFAALAGLRGRVTRIVLLGPAHRGTFSGLALPQAQAFATPLGESRLDGSATSKLLEMVSVFASDQAHAGEHSLEVELPFLQEVLGDVPIVPLLTGRTSDTEAAQVLKQVWGGEETCVVVSSDLSHYLPYAAARRLDEHTAQAIERLAPADIGEDQACGRTGVRALLLVAQAFGLRARRLDLRNSGDTAGAPDRVVGYGAFSFMD